jgi:hypothetical protein
MTTIQEIEAAIRRLSAEERTAFRAWFAEFDAEEWDRQLAADVAAGRKRTGASGGGASDVACVQ